MMTINTIIKRHTTTTRMITMEMEVTRNTNNLNMDKGIREIITRTSSIWPKKEVRGDKVGGCRLCLRSISVIRDRIIIISSSSSSSSISSSSSR